MTESNILSAITIVVSRLKRSSDRFEVFRSVLNLSITSRASNNYLNDKLLVELNYRYVEDRTLFIINKLNSLIRSDDFGKFKKFADLIVEQFSTFEGVTLLNKRLLYITEHASNSFLGSYLDYLRAYPLELSYLAKKAAHPTLFYPQIRSNLFVKTMKSVCKNLWDDKIMVLLRHLFRLWNLTVDAPINWSIMIEDVRYHVIMKKHLNLELLAYYLDRYYHEGCLDRFYISLQDIIKSLLDPVDSYVEGTVRVTQYRLERPIQEQPWFFGNIPVHEQINHLSRHAKNKGFLTVFIGSRLYYRTRTRFKLITDEHSNKGLHNVGVSNEGVVKDFELYQFYRRLVDQDLEGMKQLQYAHNFDWATISRRRNPQMTTPNSILIGHQPHPLSEYLNLVDNIREDIVEWLFELCPLNGISFEWERTIIPESHLNVIKKIIGSGGSISASLLTQYMTRVVPTKRSELMTLANAWDDVDRQQVWQFALENYQELCQKWKLISISETKMTVLLAWKFADGESIGFRNLPKELIKLIVGYLDELPIAQVFAEILAERGAKFSIYFKLDWKTWLEKNYHWGIEFFAKAHGFTYGIMGTIAYKAMNMKYFVLGRYKKFLLDLVARNFTATDKFKKFIFKYETELPNLEKLWSFISRADQSFLHIEGFLRIAMIRLTIAALKTNNVIALKFLLLKSSLVTPTREEFAQEVRYKYKLKYEDAVQTLSKIRSNQL